MEINSRPNELLALCSALESISGVSVGPSTPIETLGLTSLELLQVALSLDQPHLVEAFAKFFDPGATPTYVWDDSNAT